MYQYQIFFINIFSHRINAAVNEFGMFNLGCKCNSRPRINENLSRDVLGDFDAFRDNSRA